MSSLTDITTTAGAKVGNYFNLVSAVPSTLFVVFVFGLFSSGAPGSRPDWHSSVKAFQDVGVSDLLLLADLPRVFRTPAY